MTDEVGTCLRAGFLIRKQKRAERAAKLAPVKQRFSTLPRQTSIEAAHLQGRAMRRALAVVEGKAKWGRKL